MNGERAARHDTPWRRLPWTVPLAILAWSLALWVLSLGIAKAPDMRERVLPINARFVELPEPPVPPPPVVRPEPPTMQPSRKHAVTQPAPTAARSPSLSMPDLSQSHAVSAQDIPPSAGPAAQNAAQGLATAMPHSRPRSSGHPGATVRAESVGVIQPPHTLSIHNEENIFDTDGLGNGASPGGWMQEYTEGCISIPGMEGPCPGPVFSQPSRPWCHDANPFTNWDVGSCSIDLYQANAAYKGKDYAAAFAGFKRLAEKDYSPAQSSLGAMYAEGTGVTRDDEQAVYWWRKAAAHGDAKATYELALMYSDGKGVSRDDRQAVYWYTKAAYFGYANAQYNLGVMYALGIGVPKDDTKAVYWYRKASDRGNATAQYNLGVMYAEGTGIPKDEKQAVYWYCKGAVRGESKARSSLALMYTAGTGAPAPEAGELAYFCWLFTSDKRASQNAFTERDSFAKKLTPQQRNDAEGAARLWKSR